MSRASFLFTAAFVVMLAGAAPALAGDNATLAPDTSEDGSVSNYTFPADLYERGYFERKTAREEAERAVIRQQVGQQVNQLQQQRAAQIAEDQKAVDARVDAVLAQPSDYAGRRAALKAAPPQTQPGSGGVDTPQINPGPGTEPATGGVTGGGTGGTDPGQIDTRGDNRSVLERMMDAVQ